MKKKLLSALFAVFLLEFSATAALAHHGPPPPNGHRMRPMYHNRMHRPPIPHYYYSHPPMRHYRMYPGISIRYSNYGYYMPYRYYYPGPGGNIGISINL